MLFEDFGGPPAHGGGKPTRPGTAGGGAVAEAVGVGRASAAGGVASGLISLRQRETCFGAFRSISGAGAPGMAWHP